METVAILPDFDVFEDHLPGRHAGSELMLPCPTCPLALHATLGQNISAGFMVYSPFSIEECVP